MNLTKDESRALAAEQPSSRSPPPSPPTTSESEKDIGHDEFDVTDSPEIYHLAGDAIESGPFRDMDAEEGEDTDDESEPVNNGKIKLLSVTKQAQFRALRFYYSSFLDVAEPDIVGLISREQRERLRSLMSNADAFMHGEDEKLRCTVLSFFTGLNKIKSERGWTRAEVEGVLHLLRDT